MADNLEVAVNRPDPEHLPLKARRLVFEQVKNTLEKTDVHITFSEDEVYVVWFTFTLGNWKAMLSTTLPDGRYYEVTYNKAKNEAYIDTYIKVVNTVVDMDA